MLSGTHSRTSAEGCSRSKVGTASESATAGRSAMGGTVITPKPRWARPSTVPGTSRDR